MGGLVSAVSTPHAVTCFSARRIGHAVVHLGAALPCAADAERARPPPANPPGSSGSRTPTSCRFLLLPLSTLVSAFGSSLPASRMKVYCGAGTLMWAAGRGRGALAVSAWPQCAGLPTAQCEEALLQAAKALHSLSLVNPHSSPAPAAPA